MQKDPSKAQFNVYQTVTTKIVSMLESGLEGKAFRAPWHVPSGHTAAPINAATHAPYRGINVISLWADAQTRGYTSAYWASYRQWQSLGAQVRKGERGGMVVFYKRAETRPHEEEDHDRRHDLRFFARASTVFNAAQVDGFIEDLPEPDRVFHAIHEAEALVDAIGAVVEHGHAGACYDPSRDVIRMPCPEWFRARETSTAEESYYAVLFHELTHWSGAPKRLNRQFGTRFGDHAYALEELVAEFGAAFLCAALGISNEPREDHAVYIASWLKLLRSDSKAVFKAASEAQMAFEDLSYRAVKQDSINA